MRHWLAVLAFCGCVTGPYEQRAEVPMSTVCADSPYYFDPGADIRAWVVYRYWSNYRQRLRVTKVPDKGLELNCYPEYDKYVIFYTWG